MIYLENFKGAIRNLKFSLDIEETIESYSTIANCHYLVGEYDEAINYYKKAISIKGYDTGVYYNMAICYDQKE
jgi:tetratricopeptide (TPR) repeat protein